MEYHLAVVCGSYHVMKHKSGFTLDTLEGIRPLMALAVAKRNDQMVKGLLKWIGKFEVSEIIEREGLYAFALGISPLSMRMDVYDRLKRIC